jgi:hypothetical protein
VRAVPGAVTVRQDHIGPRTYWREHRHLGMLAASLDCGQAVPSNHGTVDRVPWLGHLRRRLELGAALVVQSVGWLEEALRTGRSRIER